MYHFLATKTFEIHVNICITVKDLKEIPLNLLCNGGNLETSEGYTCLFVVSCVLVIRNTVLLTK